MIVPKTILSYPKPGYQPKETLVTVSISC